MNHEEPKSQPHVIVEPEDGIEPVLGLMASASHTLQIKQFDFSEPSIIEVLISARHKGVDVRVMLNPNRASGQRDNDATSEALKAAGVEVEWTNPRFMVTHEKSIVVDGERALIATFNLSSKYFSQTRDYGILTHDPNHVSEVIACFEADWKRESFAPAGGTSLLWSDANARSAMAAFVDGACHTLDIQNPKFMDTTILDRVLLAHDRGVNVRVLFGGRHGTTPGDVVDTFSSLRILQRAGVKVHRQRTPKLHAKLMVADGDRVLVGSQNIDRVAFDFRRELGVIVSAGSAVNRLKEVFREDWEGAKPYMVPDPLAPVPHDPEELPRDPDFHHE